MRSRISALMLSMAAAALFVASCSGTAETAAHHNFVLVGSTPCDAAIKAALAIPVETKCDFIRWNLAMDPTNGNAFKLDANYGEAQPNTLGFVAGGQRISASGRFEVVNLKELPPRPRSADTPPKQGGEPEREELPPRQRNADTPPKQGGEPEREELPPRPRSADTPPKQGGEPEVYRLKSDGPAINVSLVKVNANLFHLLMPDGSMMLGNGGWSYTLYRKPALPGARLMTAVFAADADVPKPVQAVFEGRTACREIAELVGITPGVADCLKIKWRITLDRDAATLKPTTFTFDSTINRRESARGTWTESRSGDAIVYRLTPAPPLKPISLLVAGRDVLYFLGRNDALLTGNENFGYTLNRRLTPVRAGE